MPKTVTITMHREVGGIRTAVYEDSPTYRHGGDLLQLPEVDVINVLTRLGVDGESLAEVRNALNAAPNRYRVQLTITDEQERYLRGIFPGEW